MAVQLLANSNLQKLIDEVEKRERESGPINIKVDSLDAQNKATADTLA